MVRRGWTSSALRMRMTSMATMVPAPLSVAPVPAIQLSRWPPTMTTWSLSVGIGAGDFGDGVEAVLVVAGEFGFDVHLDGDGDVGLEEAVDAAVAFDGHDDDGDFDCVAARCRGCGRGRRRCRRRWCRRSRRRRLASRLGRMTAATFSSARNWAILSVRRMRWHIGCGGGRCMSGFGRHCR